MEDPTYLRWQALTNPQAAPQMEQARLQYLDDVTKALKNPAIRSGALAADEEGIPACSGRSLGRSLGGLCTGCEGVPQGCAFAKAAQAVAIENLGNDYARAADLYESLAAENPARWMDAGRCREFAQDVEKARSDYKHALDARACGISHEYAANRTCCPGPR